MLAGMDATQTPESEILTLDRPVPPLRIGPWSFWPPVFPAPMCGISDRAWRQFGREMGCPLVYTQMVSAEAMTRSGRDKSWSILDMFVEEPPVCAQLFGGEPDALADSAAALERAGASIIDLNMGCPVNKVVKANGGAALMRQPELVREIFARIRAAIKVPFTVKFRAGWETFGDEAFAIARLAEQEGLDAVCIHARTREQKFKGAADWSILSAVKRETRLPVIGNGDVKDAASAVRMVREHGVDGVMVGRAAMGNPWVLREIAAALRGEPVPEPPSIDERLDMVRRHARIMAMRKGEHRGLIEFRKHVVQYFRAFPYARDLKTKLVAAPTLAEYERILDRGRELIEEYAARAAEEGPSAEGDAAEDCGCE
ncbi:MAG: tRNA dihydrouridine synthase DusB [Candidatus Sumerlaeia bacterium]|nr:tRNA dihydrouridine synthase DusB [Candidatus Sumerlaeia bacterium]